MKLLGFRDTALEPMPTAPARDARASLLVEDPAEYARLIEHLCAEDARLTPHRDGLSRGETLVVLTGQQPALLGGPLYTLYKTWTALEAARRLRASGRPAIAAYWCVGDDTDHDEVRSASWPTRTGAPRRVQDERDAGGRRIGALEIARMNGAFEALRADEPGAFEIAALGGAASAGTWSAFLARALKDLAGDEPLLVVDGNDPVVQRASQPWLRAMAPHRRALAAEIAALSARLRADGGAPGLAGEEAERALFTVDGDGRRPLDADQAPGPSDVLLPNVVLRPALQEHLLNVERVVCGVGEIRYRICLAPVYARTGRAPAALARRFEATIFPGLWASDAAVPDPREVLEDPDRALDAWGESFVDAAAREALAQARAEIAGKLSVLGGPLGEADRSLSQVLESAAGKIDYQLQRIDDALRSKGRVALLRRHPALANLREFLLPRGKPQERTFSLWTPFLREGKAAREGLDAAVRTWFDRGERGHALLALEEGGR